MGICREGKTFRNWMLLVAFSTVVAPLWLHASQTTKSWASAASETTHQVAGGALIAIAALVIAGRSSQKLRFLLSLWPVVFIVMGLYLLAWSDPEIWPRGPLSWFSMLDYNAEARQHKLYAFLLLALGTVEFLAARNKLSLQWRRWSFPVLAVVGALLLTIHSHNSGLPKGWHPSQGAPVSPVPANSIVAMLEASPSQSATRQESGLAHSDHHHHGDPPAVASAAAAALPVNNQHQHHQMSPKMQRIQRQHVWMAMLGIAIAVFKFLAEGGFLQNRAIQYIWPGAMSILGWLLIVYRE